MRIIFYNELGEARHIPYVVDGDEVFMHAGAIMVRNSLAINTVAVQATHDGLKVYRLAQDNREFLDVGISCPEFHESED